jgi:hypothetical protein
MAERCLRKSAQNAWTEATGSIKITGTYPFWPCCRLFKKITCSIVSRLLLPVALDAPLPNKRFVYFLTEQPRIPYLFSPQVQLPHDAYHPTRFVEHSQVLIFVSGFYPPTLQE